MEKMTERTQLVIKDMSKIENGNILLLGVGGVGGYVFEMFSRLGIKRITVVDFDKFDETNLNRQILATTSSLGQKKVDVACNRALSINPTIQVTPICKKITKDNISSIILNDFDYVVDAIDDVSAKVAVIKYCKENNIKFITVFIFSPNEKEYNNWSDTFCADRKNSYDIIINNNGTLEELEEYAKQFCESRLF